MSIEGRIAIDVNFTDTSTAGGASSVKKISLVDTQPYTSGVVAIVTGTCGTASIGIPVVAMTYRDATGAAVSFSTVTRLAFKATRMIHLTAWNGTVLCQSSGGLAVSDSDEISDNQPPTVSPQYTSGTAAYTAVFYGT